MFVVLYTSAFEKLLCEIAYLHPVSNSYMQQKVEEVHILRKSALAAAPKTM
ncbi:MAG: hypothetical protein PHQ93_03115 [Sulfurimonas sp.]|uniref:hypothetical protein n=1 Tax=Sulfurimonas sp. TaxID=2022749 RepID=UPI00261735DE|nr:hypothetical protein [Sulfurimonas sp.]MDD5400161.1 hypothetical protein [Sulfurimonas sp.]